MAEYSNSRRKSSGTWSRSDTGKTKTGYNRGPNRPSTGGRSRPGGRQQRPIKKFDPSLFMKKVEEQAITAAYIPKNLFTDFLIDEQLKKNIHDKGYTAPTPIQDQVIPELLEGQDVIATANTGTGKTAAFLIPLINNILTKKTSRVLILTPTRELANQIRSELREFTKNLGISSVLCIGGVSINNQIRDLKHNPQFVIGTPGRLLDLEEQGAIYFKNFNAVVLDEVDTMLDMGFVKDITHILKRLPTKRHTLFFSATIPSSLKGLMDSFLHNPISVSVKTRQSAENVNQVVVHIGSKNKVDVLHDLLIKPEFKKTILFLRTKRAVDKLAKILIERGFKVATIHGDKSQAQRDRALAQFKDNKVTILLATDVVARGIDIDDVTHVINFDMPQSHEDYIHRIGRTGRADKVGQAITFVD